jgi:predicted transposase YdaD
MADIDNPLKRLVTDFPKEFASWLLNTDVLEVTTRNIELVPDREAVRADQVFHVTLADHRTVLLHIEFQGPGSKKPMPLRMLEYMSGLAQIYRKVPMYNVVFYLGSGTGQKDTGTHERKGPDGKVVLSWSYEVIHLWKMQAETIWELHCPALLPLIGLTQINHPEELLPKVVKQLRTVAEGELRQRLFTELVSLIHDEELLKMLETMLEEEDFFLNTPFLRRQRIKAREDGLAEGQTEGRAKGRAEGRAEGALTKAREDILKLLMLRFKPSADNCQRIEQQLAHINDDARLQTLFTIAVQTHNLAEFQAGLTN